MRPQLTFQEASRMGIAEQTLQPQKLFLLSSNIIVKKRARAKEKVMKN